MIEYKYGAAQILHRLMRTAIGFGTSALSYGVTYNASKAADKIICSGANKVVKGQQSLLSGSRYGKGAIKKGTPL